MTDNNSPFMRVLLYTEDGRYVTTGLIPPFLTLPKVLMWGLRVFTLDKDHKDQPEKPPEYKEAFSVAVTMTETSPNKRK